MWPEEKAILCEWLIDETFAYLHLRGYVFSSYEIQCAIDDALDYDQFYRMDDDYSHYIPIVARLTVMYDHDFPSQVMDVLDKLDDGMFFRVVGNLDAGICQEIRDTAIRQSCRDDDEKIVRASRSISPSRRIMEF